MSEKKLTLSERLDRLEAIADALENDTMDLQRSIQLYEEGVKLIKACTRELDSAQTKILKLTPQNTKIEVSEQL